MNPEPMLGGLLTATATTAGGSPASGSPSYESLGGLFCAVVALGFYVYSARKAHARLDMAKALNCCLSGAAIAGAFLLLYLSYLCAMHPKNIVLPFSMSIELPLFVGGLALGWVSFDAIMEACKHPVDAVRPSTKTPTQGQPPQQ